MANVLIGIIGVLLFIGLALAGAMYLGPRFQQASNNNQAMAVAQMAQQMTSASSLHRSEEGLAIVARTPPSNLRTLGYLNELPLNPFIDRGGWPFRVLYSGDLESSAYYADVVMVSMGPSNEAREVCAAVNRQRSGSDVIPEVPLAYGSSIYGMMDQTVGCFRMHDVGVPGEVNPHDYVTYSRI